METSCTYTDEYAYFSSDETRWKNRILKMAEKYPELVTILRRPEVNDGCVYAKFPARWMEIRPKGTSELTDEEKLILTERIKKARMNTGQDGGVHESSNT